MEKGVHGGWKLVSSLEEIEFENKDKAKEVSSEFLDERSSSGRRASYMVALVITSYMSVYVECYFVTQKE